MVDYLRYYNLETYLFEDVHHRFQTEGSLSAFDFFSIVIWKANRAKTKVARRLLDKDPEKSANLNVIVSNLTKSLFEAPTPCERLRILMEDWGFLLPMASAVLTVLYPTSFTVYDVRVCDQLSDYHNLVNRTRFDRIWASYEKFRSAVLAAGPEELLLRDMDRYLWGRSSAQQLREDIEKCFCKANK